MAKKQVKLPKHMVKTLIHVEDLVEGQSGYISRSDAWADTDLLMWVEPDALVWSELGLLAEAHVKRVEGGVELTVASGTTFVPTDKSFIRNPLPVVRLIEVESGK